MRAVWSFWTEPFRRGEGSAWLTPEHAYLSWVLSVECARRHYPDTTLVTDDAGAELLVGKLGLAFSQVSLELNRLLGRDPQWWALGKLYAYRMQTEPFVHIDGDVFLWKRLPIELETTPVFAQSPEPFDPDNPAHYYPARAVERSVAWLPDEWRRYTAGPGTRTASCCGILGGTRTSLIAEYADLAIRVAEAPENAAGWATWGNKGVCNVLIEQMMLDAVAADRGFRVAHLFANAADPYAPAIAATAGYTHLIGSAKRSPEIMANLERRVTMDFPALAERCRITPSTLPSVYTSSVGE
ncbi:MAG: hypothetical protein C0467_25060 [Planctomycetaceae bacterium]|nr:hypothetical protein [Planctomycetaceae bacterium]